MARKFLKSAAQCHKTRSLELNRHEARKMLIRELDNRINGEASIESIESMKDREKARQRRKRTKTKYQSKGDCESEESAA